MTEVSTWLDQDSDAVGGERAAEIFPIYEVAWALLKAGGPPESFASELEAADIHGDVFTPGTLEHEFWFGAWNQRIKPSRLGVWGIGFAATSMAKYGLDGLRDLDEDPEWMKVPADIRETGRVWGVRVDSDQDQVVRVQIDVDPSSTELVSRCLTLPTNESGNRKVRVWIDVREEGRLPVMVGSERLGWVRSVKPADAHLRPTRTWRGRVRVPSGTIKVMLATTDSGLAAKKAAKIVVRR